MLVVFIFCMSSVLGTVAKTLLMSIVVGSVRYAEFGEFRPSCVCYVRDLRNFV